MLKNCIGLFCLLLAGSGLASMDRIYMSPMEESRWILTSDTPLRCEIQHRIPRFGTVSFYQESGRGLQNGHRPHLEFRRQRAGHADRRRDHRL